MSKPRPVITQHLEALVADKVIWEQGVDQEWKCDAIIVAGFLRELVKLAAKAPRHEKQKFVDRFGPLEER